MIPTAIPEVKLFELTVFPDPRGAFMETYQKNRYRELGIDYSFVQDNLVISKKNVLRGLHYQLENPQGKLVQCISGAIYDIAVDIRTDSPTFCNWVGCELNEENRKQIFIPPGFAHGYCVLSNSSIVSYKCTRIYSGTDEHGIIWNDAELNINWQGNAFILSEKDRKNKPLNKSILPKYSKHYA